MNLDQFVAIFPSCKEPEAWHHLFELRLSGFDVVSPNQVANFCAQVGHESMDLNVTSENLNYSAERLKQVFPKYFRGVDATPFHRNPQMIANWVYANRMGNGPPESNDGWNYRGSGIIQLTGRNNFASASKYLYDDEGVLLNSPHFVREDKETALLCALWFWHVHELELVDDPEEVSRIVNGGTNGLEDRVARFGRAWDVLTSD